MIKSLITSFCAIIYLAAPSFADNNPPASNEPVLLHADHLTVDHEHGLIIARGKVEVIQEHEVLTADTLTYNRELDLITASGNVILHRESGDVIFGNYAELQDQMKNGVIQELRALLADDARLAANIGKRKGGTQTQLNQVVYSPCKLCKKDPSKPPLWQVKAETALWDEEAHDIIYTDATIEFFGKPVFYTPYFRHPDPKVKQRSGILTPIFDYNEDLGFVFVLPYYYVFSQDKDMTLTPIITTDRGKFLEAEYRQRFTNADLKLLGSGGRSTKLKDAKLKPGQTTTDQERDAQWRGHIDSSLDWHVTENWRIRGNALRATDRTYLRQFPFYGYTTENVLTSDAKAEGFYGLNYVRVQGLLYQGLQQGDRQKKIPKIGPLIDVNYLSPQQFWQSRWILDANSLFLYREEGTDVRRFSSTVGWSVPYTNSWGDHYNFSVRLRGDLYNRSNFIPTGQQQQISGTVGRVFPQAYLEWEYPWITFFKNGNLTLSPVATLVGAPNIGEESDFPNEDSFIIEPNDHNIMQASRFPGLDLIDDGSRLNYGIKANARYTKNIRGGAFLGQTINFHKPSSILEGTGFDERWSDYVGRISINLFEYVEARYRFRAERTSWRLVRNEFLTSFGVPIFKIHIDYLKLPPYQGETASQGGEQIVLGISSMFATGWSASAYTTREIGKGSRSLSHTGNLGFENECLRMTLQVSKSFYIDQDFKPGKNILLILAFKTAGGQVLGKIPLHHDFGTIPGDQDGSKRGLF